MKAMMVNVPGPIEEHPLALTDVARPAPGPPGLKSSCA